MLQKAIYMKYKCDCGHDFEYKESDIKSHFLMCGDSTKIEDVEKLMNGQKADMFIGDPPYGMRLDTNYSEMHEMHRGKNHEQIIGDSEDFDAQTIIPIIDYCFK